MYSSNFNNISLEGEIPSNNNQNNKNIQKNKKKNMTLVSQELLDRLTKKNKELKKKIISEHRFNKKKIIHPQSGYMQSFDDPSDLPLPIANSGETYLIYFREALNNPLYTHNPIIVLLSTATNLLTNPQTQFKDIEPQAIFDLIGATVKMDEDTRNTLDSVVAQIAGATEKMSEMQHELVLSVDTTGIREMLIDITLLVLLVTLLLNYKKIKGKMKHFSLVIIVLIILYRFRTSFDLIKLYNYLGGTDDTEPQSGDEDVVDISASLLNTFVGLNVDTPLFKAKELRDVINTASKTHSTIDGWITGMKTVSRYIISAFDTYIHGKPWIVQSGLLFLDEYLEKSREIINEYEERQISPTPTLLERVKLLITEGDNILIRLHGGQKFVGYRMTLVTVIVNLNKVKQSLLQKNFNEIGHRIEPLALLMTGPPGCGKSMSMQHFIAALVPTILSEEEQDVYKDLPSQFIYNRMIEQGFWDGYNFSKIFTLVDDLGQSKDAAGSPITEAMELIRMLNMHEMGLHIANMDGKANTLFRSRFVIATSNRKSWSWESIVDQNAFLRRWDFPVATYIRREFCTNPEAMPEDRIMNWDSLPQGKNGEAELHPDVLEFVMMKHVSNGAETGNFVISGEPPMSFDQLAHLMRARYIIKQKRHENYIVSLRNTLDYFTNLQVFNLEADIVSEILKSNTWKYQDYPELLNFFNRFRKIHGFDPNMSIVYRRFTNGNRNFKDLSIGLKDESLLEMEPIPEIEKFEIEMTQQDSKIVQYYHALKSFTEEGTSRIWQYKKEIGLVIGTLTAALLAYKLITSKTVVDPESQEQHMKIKRGVAIRTNPTPQGYVEGNQNLKNTMLKLYEKNIFRVSIPSGDPKKKSHVEIGYALGIKGHTYIMPYHFMSMISHLVEEKLAKPTDLVYFIRPGKSVDRSITLDELLLSFRYDELEPNDLAIVKVPKRGWQPLADITHLLTDDKKLFHYTNANSVLMIPNNKVEFIVTPSRFKEIIQTGGEAYDSYTIKNVLEYSALTTSGDCGSLLFVNDIKNQACLVGLHVAGRPAYNEGYSAIITKQMIIGLLLKYDETYVEEVILELPLTFKVSELDNKVSTEVLAQSHTPARIPSSKIRRSPLYEELNNLEGACKTARAKLRPEKVGDTYIDPLLKAISTYGIVETSYVPKDLCREVEEEYCDFIIRNAIHPEPFRRISFEESVLGIPGTKFRSIWRGASAGFPYNVGTGDKSKTRFFGDNEIHDLATLEAKALEVEVDNIIYKAEKGIRLDHYFTDCSKDERLPLAKVRAFETRAFSASPTAYFFAIRREFGSLALLFADSGIHIGSGITINPYQDFASLAGLLYKFGINIANIIAGDFSKFDKRQLAFLHWSVLSVIQMLYAHYDKNDNILRQTSRETLFYDVSFSRHVLLDMIVEWMNSLPSGHGLTIIVNTMYNHITVRLCFKMFVNDCLKDRTFTLALYFDDHVYLCATGDDHVMSTSKKVSKIFTGRIIQKYMPLLNMVYGPEDKGTEFGERSRDLHEVSYLKRHFVKSDIDGIIRGALLIDTVMDIPRWIKKGANVIGDTQVNVETSVMELSMHPTKIFKEKIAILLVACSNQGIQFPCTTVKKIMYDKMVHDYIDINPESYSSNLMLSCIFGNWMDPFVEPQANTSCKKIRRIVFSYWRIKIIDSIEANHAQTSFFENPEDEGLFVEPIHTNISNFDEAQNPEYHSWRHYRFHVVSYYHLYWNGIFYNLSLYLVLGKFIGNISLVLKYFTYNFVPYSLKSVFFLYVGTLLGNLITYGPIGAYHQLMQDILNCIDILSCWKIPDTVKVYISCVLQDIKRQLNCIVLIYGLLINQLRGKFISDECTMFKAYLFRFSNQGGLSAVPEKPRYADQRQDLLIFRCLKRVATTITNTVNNPNTIKGRSVYKGYKPSKIFKETFTCDAQGPIVELEEIEPQSGTDEQNNFMAVDDGLGVTNANDSDITGANVQLASTIAKPTNYVPLDSTLLHSSATGARQEIATFLERPQLIQDGTVSASDVFTTKIYSATIPHDLIYGNAIWSNKLAGSFAFRATVVITVYVNANPFQAGKYILAWVPSGGGNNVINASLSHFATLTQATQCPHVEIDLACDSEATLEIPHISCMPYAAFAPTVNSIYGNIGRVFFVPYSPLATGSGGSTTAGYSIWAHFKDVELAMPIHPQALGKVNTKVKRKVNPATQEQASAGMGPISSVAGVVKSTADFLSGVPFLSSITGPVSWAADIVGGVASLWGYSRPHNSEATSLMQMTILPKYTNVDGMDNSVKMAYSDRNELEAEVLGGVDMDEMSIAYLVAKKAYYKQVSWTTAQAEDTMLVKDALSPRAGYTVTSQAGTNIYHLSPLAYVASFFGLYRGSVKLTFKFVKTQFHSGRLALYYWPYNQNVNSAGADPNNNTSAYLHREIMDIREGNEFTFTIPYTSFETYRSTGSFDRNYGYWILKVLNPLTAPSTVSSSVVILMEISGADDMEFAKPSEFTCNVLQQLTPQAGEKDCEIKEGMLGHSNKTSDLVMSRLCVGERILSLTSLFKKYGGSMAATNSVVWSGTGNFGRIIPFGLSSGHMSVIPAFTSSNEDCDLFSLLVAPYALFRGSVRYKFASIADSTYISAQTYNSVPGPTSTLYNRTALSATINIHARNNPEAIFRPASNGGVEVDIPMYHRFHAVPVSDMWNNSLVGTMSYYEANPVPRTRLQIYNLSATWTDPYIMRAAGEDSQVGLFISVPPMTGWTESMA